MIEDIIFIVAMFLILVIIIFCFVCGYQFKKGRWLMLIAGYNTLDETTRNNIDSKKIGRESGNLSIATGIFIIFIVIAIGLSSYFSYFDKTENSLFLILVPTAIFIYYVMKNIKKSHDYYKKH